MGRVEVKMGGKASRQGGVRWLRRRRDCLEEEGE